MSQTQPPVDRQKRIESEARYGEAGRRLNMALEGAWSQAGLWLVAVWRGQDGRGFYGPPLLQRAATLQSDTRGWPPFRPAPDGDPLYSDGPPLPPETEANKARRQNAKACGLRDCCARYVECRGESLGSKQRSNPIQRDHAP